MKSVLKKAAALLTQTWLWSLLLVLSVALLVWWGGPLLAVNDHKFWADPVARLLSISVLILVWGLAMVFVSWRAGQHKKAMADSEEGQVQAREALDAEAARKTLRKRFKQALHTLKNTSVYKGRSERWRDELPWYVVLGPQGAGKTSLLDFSGLEFPLNKLDRSLTRDLRGTRDCEWYFAEHGVLIDTAGGYLTQGNEPVNASGWKTLLGLLRKRKRERPLNGVLVTVPVDSLMQASHDRLSGLSDQIRARLQDVHQVLRIELPVYLVLTKTDLIPGFTEFFEALTREERAQVFGATFETGQGGAALMRSECEALLVRLNSQVIARMHQERDTRRRGRMLDFPRQLSDVATQLCVFADMTFTGNRYQRASPLRGFYLTSAPHVPQPDETGAGAEHTRAMPAMLSGHAYFIHHLLSRVMFPEAQLAELDKRERRRLHWGQRFHYMAAMGVLAALGMLWAGSFSSNHGRLEQLRQLAQQWGQQQGQLSPRDDAKAVLQTLDTHYAATQVFASPLDTALYERTGLYQGAEVRERVERAYQHTLQTELMPRVIQQLEQQIRANLSNRDSLLNSLRAYLMFDVSEKRDPAWLKGWVANDWSMRYRGLTQVQNGLNQHFERLLKTPIKPVLDTALIAQARQVLRSESLATVVYRTLREQSRSLPPYSLAQHLGPQGHLFSGADYEIPGFYTRQGYQQYFSIQGVSLVSGILRDNWVLGEGSSISAMDMRKLMVELEQLYFHDYAEQWTAAVGHLGLEPFDDARDSAEQLAGMTSANSPVVHMLLAVRENTRFSTLADALPALPPAPAVGPLAGAVTVAADVAAKGAEAVSDHVPDTAKKALQRQFEPLHQLLDDNNGPAGSLLPLLAGLTDLQSQMAGLASASAPDNAAYEIARQRMSGQRDALSHLRQSAQRLPRPLDRWFNGVAENTWRLVLNDAYQFVDKRYKYELYRFYTRAIDRRYPFSAHSSSDVALNDFREFFKGQGLVEQFFDNWLKPFVAGEAGNYRLRSMDGQHLPMSAAFFEQIATAQIIRQGFFAQDPSQPQVQFTLEPYSLDSSVSRAQLRFGDQVIEYRHGPIVTTTLQWPTSINNGRTSLVLEKAAGRPLGIEKSTGPWSFFRVLDLMQVDYLSGRDVMLLQAEVGGLRANYLLTSQRTPNPFDLQVLRSFRLPAQL